MSLTNKVVLITGASSGIGEAAARAFDKAGAKVVLVARRKERLEAIASALNDALVIAADLSDPSEAIRMIDETVEKTGRLDILINNAATIIVSSSEEVSAEDLLNGIRTNLLSPVAAAQHALTLMRSQGSGHIINIGSPGYMMGIPFYAPYVCSKAALSAWTRTIQAEWACSGIHISEYFPGYILTDSRPESRIGEVEQDFLIEQKQNFITRTFAKPKKAEDVAAQLVRLAIKPRTLTYSGFGVKIGAYISNISSFRLSIAKQMAETARKKLVKSEK